MAPLDDGVRAADEGMIDLNVVLAESADGRAVVSADRNGSDRSAPRSLS
jgi:hypothetical protein